MKFIRTNGPSELALDLANRLKQELASGKKAAWFVSGGSAIQVAAETSHLLSADLSDLTVLLVDERYGEMGHENSNWEQLNASGFEFKLARTVPVLTGAGFHETASAYNNAVESVLNTNDLIIGLFGMGKDGHTAGILPNCPAVKSESWVSGYVGPDYQRITITPRCITKFDAAFLYAMGNEKRSQIERLNQAIDISEQPAQCLKLAKELLVYNDYLGA